MNHVIDCKGLNCPLPVINTKKYFDAIEEGIATTIVDNEVAKNNVVKFAENANLKVSVSENDNLYHITITKGEAKVEDSKEDKTLKTVENFTIVVSSDKLGNGAEELGEALIKSYLFALSEADVIPNNLIFLNSGVKLVVEGSLVLESINKLKERGVNVYSCGLCLDFYKIKDKVQVGEITNMYAIIEMMNSSRTIKL
ncbi:MAG: sulfurtransferase-like selenium metabolism protein YedF [Clostridium argentinense]|uniref:Sulfurtransferase-like selenium metabolism protein YedF n=1 Tax=Clostridium faecium TaxID=2762223 RepID=A0ABR8YN69_9CLOT|nr:MULTISPECIES: sulfurtransferase-like selenium metabolism protein YedF [Clostridium]MBD8045688.1 sulfurtransferase-like selenium metabolism protein YedF [Clostridium faecium]MBS5823714.1 sulfurtransferase-like selenium metabolism protein YedF [Clostridium argentinense]MDU1350512.1 sulfurtransferase-like selenium metabolism protein YedF [Clostridium argentinense]